MGTKITSVGTRAPWNSRILPPVTRNLEFWFDADTEARRAAFNRAIGKADSGITGAPTAAATHVSMSPSVGYVRTGVQEPLEFTAFVLAKAQSASQSTMFVASVSSAVNQVLAPGYSGGSFGMSIYGNASGTVTFAACRDNGSGVLTSAGLTLPGSLASTEWAIRVLRVKANQTTNFDKTAGVSAVNANVNTRVPATYPIRVGAPVSGTHPGIADVSQAILYSAALTDDEIDKVVDVMRKRAARLGIPA